MAVWSRIALTATASPSPTPVISTGNPGTVIHTCSTATAIKDTVYLWAFNMATTDRLLTLQLGGGTSTENLAFQTIAARDGLYGVCPGLTFVGGGATGPQVRAFSTATGADALHIIGYVDRAT